MDTLQSENAYLRSIIDAVPAMVYIVDSELYILDANRAAREMLGNNPPFLLHRLCGEVLHCLYERDSSESCGKTEFCKDCVMRNAVNASHESKVTVREKHLMKMQLNDRVIERLFSVHVAPIMPVDSQRFIMILDDITELTALRRLTNICSNCCKIKNEEDKWERIDSYLARMEQIFFSHGICPECLELLYPNSRK